MQDLLLARPWADVQEELEMSGISYAVHRTCTPRAFFKVDETRCYVVRVRAAAHGIAVTLAPGPAPHAALAADETHC